METVMGKMPEKTEAVKAQELQKLYEWVKKILPEDYDKYDIKAKYDPAISFQENKSAIREDLKILIKDFKNVTKAEATSEQEKFEHEKNLAAEREAMEYNKNLVFNDNRDVDAFYAPVIRVINKMCQGYSNLAFVKGRGGAGKSYNIRKGLIQNKADFIEICGEVTEAYLYRLIYENNGKILWFKEVGKLLGNNVGSLNILKSATETEDKKILTRSNYSKEQDDLPKQFVCNCKFIFDYNNLSGTALKEDFEALATRGDFVELLMSDDDISKIMMLICKNDEEREITKLIIDTYQNNGLVKLNLRTQWKAFRTYEYAKKNNKDWKQEIISELTNVSKIRAMLYTLIGNRKVRTTELKKIMIRSGIVHNTRTGDRWIQEFLDTEELYKHSTEDRNYLVCINPRQ